MWQKRKIEILIGSIVVIGIVLALSANSVVEAPENTRIFLPGAVARDDSIYDIATEVGNRLISELKGRRLSAREYRELEEEIQRLILLKLDKMPMESAAFERGAVELARLGTKKADAALLENDIRGMILYPPQIGGWGKSIKKFWHKHKKAILIGAAIVAAAIAVAVAVSVAGGAAAGAAGAAGAGSSDKKKDKDKEDKSSQESSQPPDNQPDPPSSSLENQPSSSNSPPDSPKDAEKSQTVPDNQPDPPFPSWENQPISSNPSTDSPDLEQSRVVSLDPYPPSDVYPISANIPEIPSQPSWPMIDDATMQTIQEMKKREPVFKLPRLGSADQSVIHFHCGINNNENSVMVSGEALRVQLNEEYAVQPDLSHNDGILHGLTMVALEKVSKATIVNLVIQGPVLPVVERCILKLSPVEESIERLTHAMSIQAEEILKENNPKLKQVHVAFSNGGYIMNEALQRLPPEYQQTVIAITAGTTAIIHNDLACKVYNEIGSKDWPSKTCNGGKIGLEKASESAKIDPIEQKETQPIIGGHYFMQPDYLRKIREIIKNVSREYEICK